MEEHFLENQSRGGTHLPATSPSATPTSIAPVLGIMPMTIPSGMHPPVGLMPNVGNNYPTPQQIPLAAQQTWAIAPPMQGLQPSTVAAMSSTNDNNLPQFYSNSPSLGGNIDITNINLTGGNNVTTPEEDDDTSLSDAPNEEEEERTDDMNIGGSDEEVNVQPVKCNQVLLPKALEDVLAFKDQRAAEYDGNTIESSVINFKQNLTTNVIENKENKVHFVGMENIHEKDINFPTETDEVYEEMDEVEQDSANEAEDNDNNNGNLNGADQLPKSLQQSKSERNKRKKRRKKLNKKLKKQQQQQQQLLHPTSVENNVDNEKSRDLTENHVQESIANNKSGEKLLINGQEKFSDAQNKKNTASLKASVVTISDSDKLSLRHSSEKKDTQNEEPANISKNNEDDVIIEYVPEKITIADLAPMYRQFYRVFEVFKLETKPKATDGDKTTGSNEVDGKPGQKKIQEKTDMDSDEDGGDADEDDKDEKEKLSKRKLKKLTRLSVAELKQLVSRPDVVEMHDVTARDPKLLVQLKAYRNTVQVPRHWCFKRKYLQGKRGIEKPPFDLPTFIKRTGIMEMRESLQERDEAKSLKMKMRERVRPKMGKIDIDYQKLHDAFFKWQTKPRMTIHGDLYYEGKEFETRLKEKKPGDLSEELRIALGMPVGPNSHKIPPPWLIAQQRYGPPPSYPNLKIPGLNAPIPDGCAFGYHAGGWGKPPVDENGKPLYGDVFGTNIIDIDNGNDEADIERNQWGELESESEESSEEEEEDGEDLTNQADESGLVTPAEGLVTPSGLNSVPAGMETPDSIELRKKKIEQEMEDNETPVLYHVLPEKRTDRVGASMMGSTHVYDVASAKQPTVVRATTAAVEREGTVELALDPSELDMDNDAMAQRYEQQMREQQSHLQKEDLSDMLAEHVARQKSKRKRQTDPAKSVKKYKEFKF